MDVTHPIIPIAMCFSEWGICSPISCVSKTYI